MRLLAATLGICLFAAVLADSASAGQLAQPLSVRQTSYDYYDYFNFAEEPAPTPDTPDLYEEASETGAVGGLLSGLQSLATGIFRRIRRHWESSILGFSRAKQRRVFEELSAVTSSLAERAGGIVGPLMPGLPGSGLVQVASLVVLLTVGGMGFYLAARWTLARLGHGTPGGSAVPPVWFYRDMVVILNRKGIRRPPHLTPREFVPMAAAQLAGPPAGGGPLTHGRGALGLLSGQGGHLLLLPDRLSTSLYSADACPPPKVIASPTRISR